MFEKRNATDKSKIKLTPETIEKLSKGEITLGQCAGLTCDNLYQIAHTGFLLLTSGKFAKAKVIYRGLVAADPQDSVFHCHLAAVHHRLGEFDDALTEYTVALRFNISNVDALAGRGAVHLARGELSLAVADLKQAVRLDPQNQRASTARAQGLLRMLTEALANGSSVPGTTTTAAQF